MKRDGKVEKEPEDKKRCGGGAIFFFFTDQRGVEDGRKTGYLM